MIMIHILLLLLHYLLFFLLVPLAALILFIFLFLKSFVLQFEFLVFDLCSLFFLPSFPCQLLFLFLPCFLFVNSLLLFAPLLFLPYPPCALPPVFPSFPLVPPLIYLTWVLIQPNTSQSFFLLLVLIVNV